MSADRLEVCPRCLHRAVQVSLVAIEQLDARYGTVSAAEYSAARLAIPDVDPEEYRTFALTADPSFGSGVIDLDYYGGCTVCQLSFAIHEVKRFYTPHDSTEETPA